MEWPESPGTAGRNAPEWVADITGIRRQEQFLGITALPVLPSCSNAVEGGEVKPQVMPFNTREDGRRDTDASALVYPCRKVQFFAHGSCSYQKGNA
jgi:hypothetical protein